MGKQHSKVTGRYRASCSECPLQTPNAFIPAGCFQGTHPKKPDDSFPPCRPSCNEKLSSSRTLTVIFMDSHGWSWMTKAKGSKRFRNISNLLRLMTFRTLLKRFEHNLTHMNTMFFASGPKFAFSPPTMARTYPLCISRLCTGPTSLEEALRK